MSTAATLPFTPAPSTAAPWSPTDRDHLIFQWVKFDGQTQSWVVPQKRYSRSGFSAPAQAMTWSNTWPTACSWNGLGLKVA